MTEVKLGLRLSEAVNGLGKRLGERGVLSVHHDLHPRKYYRLKSKINGTIQSAEAKAALWRRAEKEFELGGFDPSTEWLVSTLITMTIEAIKKMITSIFEHL
jgi:hypothetical protein